MTRSQKIEGNNQEVYVLRRLRVISFFKDILVAFVFLPTEVSLLKKGVNELTEVVPNYENITHTG